MAPIHVLRLLNYQALSGTQRNELQKLKETLQRRRRELDLAISHVNRMLKQGPSVKKVAKKLKRKAAKKGKRRSTAKRGAARRRT
jgi:hypothetical protein